MTAHFASAIIISNPEEISDSNQPPTIHMLMLRVQLQEVLYGKYIFISLMINSRYYKSTTFPIILP